MFRYKSTEQIGIGEFKVPSGTSLRADNRWVKLAGLLPWGELAEIYGRTLHPSHGAPSVDARVVIGAMLIKHKLKLDDRGTIEMIQENPYMQYFLGLDAFRPEAVFDASLFVAIRKRLGAEAFDEMSGELAKRAREMETSGQAEQRPKEPLAGDPPVPPTDEPADPEGQSVSGPPPPTILSINPAKKAKAQSR